MVSYSTYMSKSFTLGAGSVATNFIRSQFDYGARQRRGIRGYDVFNARLVLDEDNGEMSDWLTFWDALNYGNDKFYTNEVINADTTTTKIARFISAYEISQIGDNKFIVTVPLELISTGTKSVTISDTGVTGTFSVNAPIVTVV